MRIYIFWCTACIALLLDLLSKSIVFKVLNGPPPADINYSEISQYSFWVLPRLIRFMCHYNIGGAFGWGAGNTLMFLTATAILVPIIIMIAYQCQVSSAPLWALGLIIGGAIGNLYDRLFYPGVRDFIDIVNPRTGLSLWPIFNIADIAIVLGVGVYLLWSLFFAPKSNKKHEATKISK